MENLKDIRWKQRYTELVKVNERLGRALDIPAPDDIYRAGIIQFFEMTFELSWKTLKDFLESQGNTVNTPREVVQVAFNYGIIEEGHAWIDALQKRNLMAHTYDESRAMEAEGLIRGTYYAMIVKLIRFLESKV